MTAIKTIGFIGFGAFARLAAKHLAPHFAIKAHDPHADEPQDGVALTTLWETAACDAVVFATPVSALESAAIAAAPHLRPGALVLDVGSVKVAPAEILQRVLPPGVELIGTHPLFGPQSAKNGIEGLKIALCPLRSERTECVANFLRGLGLEVIVCTPEEHDREAATVQGLTHLIAKILVQMEPLPEHLTTRSYELLIQAISLVRHDPPGVFEAIERTNPYAAEVRARFLAIANEFDDSFKA